MGRRNDGAVITRSCGALLWPPYPSDGSATGERSEEDSTHFQLKRSLLVRLIRPKLHVGNQFLCIIFVLNIEITTQLKLKT